MPIIGIQGKFRPNKVHSGRMEHGRRLMPDDVPALALYLVHPTFAPFRRFSGLAAQVPEAILRENRDERVAAREATANSSEISAPTMWAVERLLAGPESTQPVYVLGYCGSGGGA